MADIKLKKIIIGTLIGVIFIYLAFRRVNVSDMFHVFSKANYFYVLIAIFLTFFSHLLRALRWKYFLKYIKNISIKNLFFALIIGYAANTFFPAHLGEFLRAYVLGKKYNISTSSTFASIVVERIVDVFTLTFLMALVVFIHPFPWWVVKSGYIMLASALGLLIVLIGFKHFEAQTTLVILHLLKPLPEKIVSKLNSIILNFLWGVTPLKSFYHFIVVICLSVAIWLCYASIYYICLKAFSFVSAYQLPWYASLVVLVITTISIVVPSSPGYVGTYHFLCQISLMVFGIPKTEALSFATIAHVINIFPVTLLGLIVANYEGISIYHAEEKK